MAGVIEVRELAPVGVAIQDTLLIVVCMRDDEVSGRVLYVPL